MTASTQTEPQIGPDDKDYPYKNWTKAAAWRDQLYKRATHKALDIAEDMDFNQRIERSSSGMGWKELAVIAAAILGGGALGLHYFKGAEPTQQTGPVDSEYEVRFFDADGNPIDVPHISQRER